VPVHKKHVSAAGKMVERGCIAYGIRRPHGNVPHGRDLALRFGGRCRIVYVRDEEALDAFTKPVKCLPVAQVDVAFVERAPPGVVRRPTRAWRVPRSEGILNTDGRYEGGVQIVDVTRVLVDRRAGRQIVLGLKRPA